MTQIWLLDSQRDDARGEALGDSLGVHTEGTVFGAGASRRTAGDLGGSPGTWFPRQAQAQTQNQHAHHPSRPKLQHPWAGGAGSHVSELLEVCPQVACWDATVSLPTTPAVLIMLSTETARERERERNRGWVTEIGTEGGGRESPVHPRWVCRALQLSWICAASVCLRQELLPACTLQKWRATLPSPHLDL